MAPKGKKVAPAPFGTKKAAAQTKNPLFEKRPRNFTIGNDVLPKKDLTRFTKWPEYVRLQRQRKVLRLRLKVPPSINQFNQTLDKNTAANLFKFLNGYRPETKQEKKTRLAQTAETTVKTGEKPEATKPYLVKYGLNHITALVESKKAKLVVIANDVDPIELVLWLPALCRKMGIPYCIVKDKSRLGAVVHKKTATALAITDVKDADANTLAKIIEAVNSNYANKFEDIRKTWGGGIMGHKSQAAQRKKDIARAKDISTRAANAAFVQAAVAPKETAAAEE